MRFFEIKIHAFIKTDFFLAPTNRIFVFILTNDYVFK